jgi:hypothetical protein
MPEPIMVNPNPDNGQLNAQPNAGTGNPPEGTIEVEGKKYVPVEKFSASAQEAIRLAQENELLKKPKEPSQPQQMPEEEKKVREILTKMEQEKVNQDKADQLQLRKELDELHTVYGEFDETKLQKIVERYGTKNSDNSVLWDSAMELYKKIGDVPDKEPKEILAQQRSNPNPIVPEIKVEIGHKSLHELAQEGLKKFGINN